MISGRIHKEYWLGILLLIFSVQQAGGVSMCSIPDRREECNGKNCLQPTIALSVPKAGSNEFCFRLKNIIALSSLKTFTIESYSLQSTTTSFAAEKAVGVDYFSTGGLYPDTINKKIRKDRAEEENEKNLRILPLAAPAYTPELGPTLMGVMMVSFKTNPADTAIQRSSTPVSIGASLRGSYFFNTIISTYWLEDRLRVFGEIRFRNMPDHYWGVGYENASENRGRDETTAYTRRYWRLNPKILWQFRKDYFLGLNIDYHSTKVMNPNPIMETDPYYLAFGPANFNSGVGVIARYDSRDVPVNPWKGSLLDFEHILYSRSFGGNNNFSVTTIDVRHFQEIFRPGSTLATELKLQHTSGEVPYTNLAMLGSPYDLRGYFLGHYRDRSMLFIVTEYRHQFLKRDGNVSRHGMVGWLGTGSIANSFGDYKKWLPNAGIGYRFEVQSRMNVRAEIGFGRQSTGFYISFNEAF